MGFHNSKPTNPEDIHEGLAGATERSQVCPAKDWLL